MITGCGPEDPTDEDLQDDGEEEEDGWVKRILLTRIHWMMEKRRRMVGSRGSY